MRVVGRIAQTLAALGILNVWIVRFNRETEFRGGSATNLPEEFDVYGLPRWMVYVTGATKVSLALTLLAGLRAPRLVRPAAERAGRFDDGSNRDAPQGGRPAEEIRSRRHHPRALHRGGGRRLSGRSTGRRELSIRATASTDCYSNAS